MAHLVDHVCGGARTLPALDGRAPIIVRGTGPYLLGDNGRRDSDTALGFGGTILGHAKRVALRQRDRVGARRSATR